MYTLLDAKQAVQFVTDNGYNGTDCLSYGIKEKLIFPLSGEKDLYIAGYTYDEETGETWYIDSIERLTDEFMEENDILYRYRYLSHPDNEKDRSIVLAIYLW